MQTCKNCHAAIPDDAHSCPYCGRRVQRDDARRHLLMRMRLGALPTTLAATATAGSYVIVTALILASVILLVSLRPHATQSSPPTQPTLIVTPRTLDFGKIEVGKKVIKSVVIETSSVTTLSWNAVSGNSGWLSIAKGSVTKSSDNLSEVVYDVTANTSTLHDGAYSVIYNIDAARVKDQQVKIDVQVIPSSPKPLPAKLNVNPLSLDFGTQNAGSQVTQLLTVSNSGQMDLNWIADKGSATWLTLDTSQGKIAPGELPQVIKVMVNTTTLPASQYSAVINFTSNGGTASVDITLNVVITPTTNGPEVTSVSPSSGINDGGTIVVLTGSGFTGASMVSFGPVQVAASGFTVAGDTQITIVSPPANKSDLSSTVDVTVTTPIGTSATSSADHFTYYPTIPIVKKVSPNQGSIAGGKTVTILGSGFTNATAVSFGTVMVVSGNIKVNSDDQITVVSPAPVEGDCIDVICNIVNVDVTVTTPIGTSKNNDNDKFTYIFPPIVSGISSKCGPTTGGTNVIITGSSFSYATSVFFGTVSAQSFAINSDTEITAVSPAGSGTVDVTVTNPGGTSAKSQADQFIYPPPPEVTNNSPIIGPMSGGTTVTITGSYLTCATSVTFGTIPASFTIDSDTQITAVSPAGNGTVDVTVTTPGGTSTTGPSDQFTYLPPPTVTSINPTSESSNKGGYNVIITGTGFSYATSVSFGTIPASFTIDSDTQITAVSPPVNSCPTFNGTVVPVNVTVTTPGGNAAAQYEYCYIPIK
jgi:hypothetical protein